MGDLEALQQCPCTDRERHAFLLGPAGRCSAMWAKEQTFSAVSTRERDMLSTERRCPVVSEDAQ